MKYRELPIDDSKGVEQFKAGDIIKAFTKDDWYIFKAYRVLNTRVYKDIFDSYHWKQCRKLEKVKPREFWICTNSNCHQTWSKDTVCAICKTETVIHVREVIDVE